MMKKIINMMIYKELRNSNINQLSVIYSYEVNLNLFLGAKWKEAILHAQKERTMHHGQYGGLPGQDCTQIKMLEEYSFEGWKMIINMMIYKEFRNSHINQLSMIYTYEAILLGSKWK